MGAPCSSAPRRQLTPHSLLTTIIVDSFLCSGISHFFANRSFKKNSYRCIVYELVCLWEVTATPDLVLPSFRFQLLITSFGTLKTNDNYIGKRTECAEDLLYTHIIHIY